MILHRLVHLRNSIHWKRLLLNWLVRNTFMTSLLRFKIVWYLFRFFAGKRYFYGKIVTHVSLYFIVFHLIKKRICDRLRNLVPFLQFQKREKRPWRSGTFNKIKGFSLTSALIAVFQLAFLCQAQVKAKDLRLKLKVWLLKTFSGKVLKNLKAFIIIFQALQRGIKNWNQFFSQQNYFIRVTGIISASPTH